MAPRRCEYPADAINLATPLPRKRLAQLPLLLHLTPYLRPVLFLPYLSLPPYLLSLTGSLHLPPSPFSAVAPSFPFHLSLSLISSSRHRGACAAALLCSTSDFLCFLSNRSRAQGQDWKSGMCLAHGQKLKQLYSLRANWPQKACFSQYRKIEGQPGDSSSSNINAWVSVHWRARCHAKWPRGCREIQHPEGIEPMLPKSLQLKLNKKPWIFIDLKKMTYHVLQPWNDFFIAGLLSFQDCSSWISRPDTIYRNSWLQTFYQYISSPRI